MRFPLVLILVCFGSALIPGRARAGWQECGVTLCRPSDGYALDSGISDDSGGAIFVSSGSGSPAIVACRITGDGDPVADWPECGILVLPGYATLEGTGASTCSDGAGGCIISWTQHEPGACARAYVQRVTPAGAVAPGWPTGGLRVSSACRQYGRAIVADGSGGAFIVWNDEVSQAYAQHVLASGNIASGWPPEGRRLFSPDTYQMDPTVVSDGSGGALCFVSDSRNDGTRPDIYGQRMTSDGTIAWGPAGAAICTMPGWQRAPIVAVPDGVGGAVVAWWDTRNAGSTGYDLYSQRVNAAGDRLWPLEGVPLCTSPGDQSSPACAPDGSGGAYVEWNDERDPADHIYMQHLTSNGMIADGWPVDGLRVDPTAVASSHAGAPVPDGFGGVLASTVSYHGGYLSHLRLHRILSDGSVNDGWPTDGLVLCPWGFNSRAGVTVADGTGGAMVAWGDALGDSMYVQRISPDGLPVASVSPFDLAIPQSIRISVAPNPSAETVHIGVSGPTANVHALDIFDVRGRRLCTLDGGTASVGGQVMYTWNGSTDQGTEAGPGFYFLRARGQSYYRGTSLLRLR